MSFKPVDQIKVVLADSNPMILSAMSEKFSSDPRISLISTVTTAEDFLSTVLRVKVDLGIVCWTLPQLGGEKLLKFCVKTRRLQKFWCMHKIIHLMSRGEP